MEFIKEGKREGHGYDNDKDYTLKDVDDALRKQAEEIREWLKTFDVLSTNRSDKGLRTEFDKRFLK